MSSKAKKKENIFLRILKYFLPWKGDSAKEVIRKIVFITALIALIISVGYFAVRFSHRNDYSGLTGLSDDIDWEDDSKQEDSFDRYEKLLAINPEFCGWLKIDGTGIDVPLVQSQDNEKYLKTSFYAEYSEYGNPFVDYRNDMRRLSKNTVVYGHNMKDNMVFAELLQYEDLDFYKEHPTVYLGTLYEDTYWKIVSVFITNALEAQDNGYYFEYNFVGCDSENFDDYIAELEKRSLINTGVDVNSSDKLLTLSTCEYDITEGRFIVVARQVRPGEEKTVDTSKASVNKNPKFPQAYCDAKGIDNVYRDDERWKPYD